MVEENRINKSGQTPEQPVSGSNPMDEIIAADYTATDDDPPDVEMFFPPEAGEPIPREGYVPIPGEDWENKLYETTHTPSLHRGGATYSATLYGLDSRGRAVYCTGSYEAPRLTYLAPKFHRHFDVADDERPFRSKPPKHGCHPGEIINAPNNSVLAEVKEVDPSGDIKRTGIKSVIARAIAEEWTYIAPPLVGKMSNRLNRRSGYGQHNHYPYTACEKLIGNLANIDELSAEMIDDLPNHVLEMMVDGLSEFHLRRDTINALPDKIVDEVPVSSLVAP